MRLLVAVYLLGVVVGLWRGDAPPLRRLGLALSWPVALFAGLITVSGLTLLVALLFPAVSAALVLAAALSIWFLRS